MKYKIFPLLLFGAMTLGIMAGCSEKPEQIPEGRIAVNLKTDIGQSIRKVANDQWEASDNVGLYMKKAGKELAEPDATYNDAKNALMTIAGQTLTANPPVMYPESVFPETVAVDFIAYYPYNASPDADFTIPVNVATQSANQPVEILYSDNAKNQMPTTVAVPLNFKYLFAKFVVTVTGDENSTLSENDFENMYVTALNLHTQAKLQLADGTFVDRQNRQNIALHKTGYNATSASFEALLLPATGLNLVINAGGINHSYVNYMEYTAARYEVNVELKFNEL